MGADDPRYLDQLTRNTLALVLAGGADHVCTN